MKPHRLADLANALTAVATQYGHQEQCRERILSVLVDHFAPEHGNRGPELETAVLVDARELEAACAWEFDQFRIEKRDGRLGTKYRVSEGLMVLGKDGEWDMEPMPSSCSDAWLSSHRFDTFALALDALRSTTGGA